MNLQGKVPLAFSIFVEKSVLLAILHKAKFPKHKSGPLKNCLHYCTLRRGPLALSRSDTNPRKTDARSFGHLRLSKTMDAKQWVKLEILD